MASKEIHDGVYVCVRVFRERVLERYRGNRHKISLLIKLTLRDSHRFNWVGSLQPYNMLNMSCSIAGIN